MQGVLRRACWKAGATSLLASVAMVVAAGQPVTHRVVIENMRFEPATLKVHAGDLIVWVNKDLFPHTVTASSGNLKSGSIAASATWSFRANRVGIYAYICSFHPVMQGRVEVQP